MAKDKPKPEPKPKVKAKEEPKADLLKTISTAISPLSKNLHSIDKNTAAILKTLSENMGASKDKGAEEKFEKKNMFSKMFDGMKGMFGDKKDKKESTGLFGWLKDNWGKLLIGIAGLALLFAPLDQLIPAIKGIWSAVQTGFAFAMEHPIFTGISAALLAAFGPGGVLMGIGGVLKGGLALAKFAAGAAGPLAIVAAIAKTIYDGVMGAKISEEWGVSKTSGVVGAVLGGTGKGMKNAFAKGAAMGAMGAGIGFMAGGPIGAVLGGVIGSVVGGILGWIGGEKIAKTIQKVTNKLSKLWNGVVDGLGLMVGDFKVYLIDPMIDFFGKMKDWASNAITSMIPEKALNFFGMGKKKPTASKEKIIPENKKNKPQWMMEQAGGGGNKQSAWMEKMGGKEKTDQMYKDYKSAPSGSGSAPSGSGSAPSGSGSAPTARVSSKGPRSAKFKKRMAKRAEKSATIKANIEKYNASKLGGKEHTKVKEHQADMGGVAWNKLGGRDTIEGIVLSTWNKAGLKQPPTFTSGFRSKNHKLSKKNPDSQHIQKTAFDLRSNDLGSKAPEVFSNLMSVFGPMGLWGQHETAGVNAENRSGEHFHFQLAAKGFGGVVNKATGFIAGEDGPERVDIVPLSSPSTKMDSMNAAHKERTASQGGTPSINVVTSNSNQTTNAQDQSSMVMLQQQRPKPIKV